MAQPPWRWEDTLPWASSLHTLGMLSSAASLASPHSVEGVRPFLHFHSSHLANKVKTSCNSLRADAIVAVGSRWKIKFLSASRKPRSTQISLPVPLTLLYRKYLQVREQVWSSHCWGIKTWKYPFLILKSLHYNYGTHPLKRQFLYFAYSVVFSTLLSERKTKNKQDKKSFNYFLLSVSLLCIQILHQNYLV